MMTVKLSGRSRPIQEFSVPTRGCNLFVEGLVEGDTDYTL